MEISNNVTSIVTGISYIRDAIQDQAILNLANTGQDIEHDYEIIKRYLPCMKGKADVRNIIIGLYPYCLRYSMEKSKANRMQMLLYQDALGNISEDIEFKYYEEWYKQQKYLIEEHLKIDKEQCFFQFFLPAYGKVDLFRRILSYINAHGIKSM